MRKSTTLQVLLLATLSFAACKPAETGAAAGPALADGQKAEAHDHAAPAGRDALTPPPLGEGAPDNALQAEMRALTAAMQVALVAVANDQLQLIPPALGQVHGAMEETQAALEAGRIQLPRHPEDVEGFLAADEAFHDSLVGLLRAAKANDAAAAGRQLGVIMEGCTSCHARYRFEPGTTPTR